MWISKYFDEKWSMFSFICLALFMGLFYQVAWQYPVTDAFPLIERLLDQNFLKQDFYTNTFLEFSPRLATAKVIVALSIALDMDYTLIIAYGNIIRIWLYAIALYCLFYNLTDKKTALIAFVFSSLSFLSMPFLPAWWPISYDLTSSNIALVFAMFSWVFATRGSVSITLLLLSLTVHIHPVVGVQALLISVIIYICIYKFDGVIASLKNIKVYIASVIFLTVFLITYFSFEQILPDEDFININGKFRHAHHFEFAHMAIEKWISTILMVVACLLITAWYNKKNNKQDSISIPIIIYSGLMVLLGYLFAELYPTRFMISFIPLRAFPILVPIIMLAFARLAMNRFHQKDYVSFFLLFLPFIPYNHIGLTWYLLPTQHEMVLPIIVTTFVLLAVVIQMQSMRLTEYINNRLETVINSNIGVSLIPISLFAFVLVLAKFDIEIPKLETEPNIYSWLNTHTDENSIIISELNAADNQKIRLIARRAVVISKDFPFNENFYHEWKSRYVDIYQHRDNARGRIDSLNTYELNVVADKYKATHLIRTEPLDSHKHFTLIGNANGETATAYIYKNNQVNDMASL